MDPKGKVVIISGGASGIGLATAKLLAAHGARIVIADLQDEAGAAAVREIEALGREARFVHTDVTKGDDIAAALAFAAREFGRVDVIYNNAGVSERGDFFALHEASWERTLRVNLEAVIRAISIEVPFLRKQGGGGVIISTGSMGGMIPMPTNPVYAATKAGVIQFTRSLAYLAGEGIRVNVVCPTVTDTPMVRAGGEQAMEAAKRELGGILVPEQVAAGVLELIQDDSRAGAVMRVTITRGIDYTFEPRK